MSIELTAEKLTDDDYFASERLSNSKLSLLKRCPELYKREIVDGIAQPPTDAMKIGSLVHCLALEPSTLYDRYAIAPKFDMRRTIDKDARKAFESRNEGKIVISETDFAIASCMSQSILNHEIPQVLLDIPHEVEVPIMFEFNGMECKAKLDYLSSTKAIVMDIKTTSDPSKIGFRKSVEIYGYHRQAAFYREAVRAAYGVTPRVIFVAVGNAEPYLCGCYELSPETFGDADPIEEGLNEIIGLMEELKQRTATNDWASDFTKGVNKLSLSRWYLS